MHKEEGIIDAGDPENAHEIRRFAASLLHRYHLFLLEIHNPNRFLLLRQGHFCQLPRKNKRACRMFPIPI